MTNGVDIDETHATSTFTDAASGGELAIFNEEAASILLSVFGCSNHASIEVQGGVDMTEHKRKSLSKTASVKFMITLQDEKDLRDLGYSQDEIDRMKPQEAADILKARVKANATE